MAKRSKSKANATGVTRSTPQTLTQLLSPAQLRPSPVNYINDYLTSNPLHSGDRRRWQPDRSVRNPAITRKATRLNVKPAKTFSPRIQFNIPKEVAVCARRTRRREVLFAKRAKIGSGLRRRNLWSKISC